MPFLPYIQLLSLTGAVLILAAFAGSTFGWLDSKGQRYAALNFFGSAALAYVATVGLQYGFILLEGSWALISLYGWVRASGHRETIQ
jgi:hypothetical protein